jgi:hypothetical protein
MLFIFNTFFHIHLFSTFRAFSLTVYYSRGKGCYLISFPKVMSGPVCCRQVYWLLGTFHTSNKFSSRNFKFKSSPMSFMLFYVHIGCLTSTIISHLWTAGGACSLFTPSLGSRPQRTCRGRVEIGGLYTTTLYMMVDIVKWVGVHPPPPPG